MYNSFHAIIVEILGVEKMQIFLEVGWGGGARDCPILVPPWWQIFFINKKAVKSGARGGDIGRDQGGGSVPQNCWYFRSVSQEGGGVQAEDGARGGGYRSWWGRGTSQNCWYFRSVLLR